MHQTSILRLKLLPPANYQLQWKYIRNRVRPGGEINDGVLYAKTYPFRSVLHFAFDSFKFSLLRSTKHWQTFQFIHIFHVSIKTSPIKHFHNIQSLFSVSLIFWKGKIFLIFFYFHKLRYLIFPSWSFLRLAYICEFHFCRWCRRSRSSFTRQILQAFQGQ